MGSLLSILLDHGLVPVILGFPQYMCCSAFMAAPNRLILADHDLIVWYLSSLVQHDKTLDQHKLSMSSASSHRIISLQSDKTTAMLFYVDPLTHELPQNIASAVCYTRLPQ